MEKVMVVSDKLRLCPSRNVHAFPKVRRILVVGRVSLKRLGKCKLAVADVDPRDHMPVAGVQRQRCARAYGEPPPGSRSRTTSNMGPSKLRILTCAAGPTRTSMWTTGLLCSPVQSQSGSTGHVPMHARTRHGCARFMNELIICELKQRVHHQTNQLDHVRTTHASASLMAHGKQSTLRSMKISPRVGALRASSPPRCRAESGPGVGETPNFSEPRRPTRTGWRRRRRRP